jgi:hypothetical protein
MARNNGLLEGDPDLKRPAEMREHGAEVFRFEDLDLLFEVLPPRLEPQLLAS